ncbi:hypothetical protein NPIL_240231 [Nephila pilipes]|uniref:Uncharacterized protein n=1 Tax=Nephila pilipes TaxID=299642 RepID=A0A8X6JPE3_NEPPI|nr:hypothetical protein NPIL_240231 [Nephila pilipes]
MISETLFLCAGERESQGNETQNLHNPCSREGEKGDLVLPRDFDVIMTENRFTCVPASKKGLTVSPTRYKNAVRGRSLGSLSPCPLSLFFL